MLSILYIATPNSTCSLKKCAHGLHQNAAPLHLIYKSLHSEHTLLENQARP